VKKLKFPSPFRHDHPAVTNVNDLFAERITVGQRASDWIARIVGSWKFIIVQSVILTFWVILNLTAWVFHWDPYPFILMNLFLSMQAAYTAPIIMMSQNRQAARDRLESHNDYLVNLKAEEEVRTILEHLEAQDNALKLIYHSLQGAAPGDKGWEDESS
jgi:uncharacterized membrane protein